MSIVDRRALAFIPALTFALTLFALCLNFSPAFAVDPAELEAARQAFEKAYETYTRLATTGGEGDIEKALAEYKQTYYRYQQLKQKAESAPPPEPAPKTAPKPLPEAAPERPAEAPPAGIEAGAAIALNVDQCTHPMAPSDTDQVITFDTRLTLTVPAGALQSAQTLFIHPMTGTHIDAKLLGPLTLFDIRLGGQTRFDPPLVIELPFDPARLKADRFVQSQLLTATYDESENRWRYIPCKVDLARKRLVITTDHLSGFADFEIRDQMLQQAIQRELEALKQGGQATAQRVSETIDRVAGPVIEKATAAYDATSGAVGKVWAKARDAYDSVSSTVSSTVDSAKKLAGDVSDAAVAAYNVSADLANTLKTYNLGECHLTPYFRIYYTEADINDPTKIVYKGSGAKAASKVVMPYADVKAPDAAVHSDTVSLTYTPPPPSGPPKVIPEYIRDLGTALDAAYAYYKQHYRVPEGFTDVVVCGSNIDPFYEKITKFILINYNMMTYDQLRTTAAHEFFHRVQHLYVNVIDMKRFLWLVESTAEYVSIEGACGLSMSRFRPIGIDFLKQPLFETGNEREYTAGHFFSYLARRRGFSLKGFFEYFGKTYGLEGAESYLDAYLRETAKTSLADAYAGFAADMLLSAGGALAATDAHAAFNQFPAEARTVKTAGADTGLTLSAAAYRAAVGGVRAELGTQTQEFTISVLEKENRAMAQVYLLPGNVKPDDLKPAGTLAEPGDSVRVQMKTGDVVYLVGTNPNPEGGMFFARIGSAGLKVSTDYTKADFRVVGANGARYDWDFGDGNTQSTADGHATHNYDYEFKPASGGGSPFSEDLQFDTKVYAVSVQVYDAAGKRIETVRGEARLIPLRSVKTSP